MTYFKTHTFGVLTIVLITILSLMPAQEFPQVDVQFADKWTHWIMYGFLTTVMGVETIMIYHRKENSRSSIISRFLYIFLFSCFWGGLMELGQSYLTTTRHGDWMDALANSFGALCAFIGLTVYHLKNRK